MRARGVISLLAIGIIVGAGATLGWVYGSGPGRDLADALESGKRTVGYIERAQNDSRRIGFAISEAQWVTHGGGTISNRLRLYADRIDAIGREWNRLDKGLAEAIPSSTP